MVPNGGHDHRSDASALRTVWFAPELAGNDVSLQICGDGCGGLSEYAVRWRFRGICELLDLGIIHIQLWIERAQSAQFSDALRALFRLKYLFSLLADLRRKDTHPHLPHF